MRYAQTAIPFIVVPLTSNTSLTGAAPSGDDKAGIRFPAIPQVGLLLCLIFAATTLAYAQQFKEIGPAPIPPDAAGRQIRELLTKVDAGNRPQTVATISGLLPWYRDLADEEMVLAWQGGGRGNLPEVIELLADPHLASAIVEFSWRERKQAFTLAYAPMLGHLMARYPDSAKPFLDDLLGPAETGQQMPALSEPAAETVCRILFDISDSGTWRKNAQLIVPHYRAAAEAVLAQDLRGDDREKSYRAQFWMSQLNAPGSGPGVTAARPPRAVPEAPAAASPSPSNGKRGGAILTALDPATVDDTARSINSGTPAVIDFLNRSSRPVDIYWITYDGNRMLYAAGVKAGATSSIATFIGHPWLVVASGTGGTTARDSGTRLAAFQAVTPSNARDPSVRDTAIITNPDGTSEQNGSPASAPGGPGTAGPDGIYRIGNGVSAPSVLTKIDPTYSGVAAKLNIGGRLTLSIVIEPSGVPRDTKVIKSLGYGLDESAMDAVRKWRFRPSMKDGAAVPVRATVEVNFPAAARRPNVWYFSGLDFGLDAGLRPPLIKDVAMPKPANDSTSETLVLGFTIDSRGAVKNIHSISGSQSGAALLSPSLAAWKFQPAMQGNQPIETTGTVTFSKGQAAVTANPLPSSPPFQNPPVSVSGTSQAKDAATVSVAGTLRRLAEKDLLLQASSGRVLRFRLILKTEFRGNDGKPVRDSLIHPGDRITVVVNPDDVETAVYVILTAAGSNADRETASAPVEEARIVAPEPSDFGDPCSALASRALELMRNPPNNNWKQSLSGPLGQIQSEGLNAYINRNGGISGLMASTRRDLAGVKGDKYSIALNQAWIDLLGCMSGQASSYDSVVTGEGSPQANNITKPVAEAKTDGLRAPAANPVRTASQPVAASHDPMVNARDGLSYVWIPRGSFTMGCSPGDTECFPNEKPPHAERIANGFWLGRTEVTQAAWQRVTGGNPSAHKGDQLPVETVTWNDAASYCAAIDGRLPTEAEWEYAARAGTTWARYGDLGAVAWHTGNSGGMTHAVGLKQSNAFGLYDMLGNVWEWVEGAYPGTSDKIMRGGASFVDPSHQRASRRSNVPASASTSGRGFRCVMNGLDPDTGIAGPVYSGGNGVSAPVVIRRIEPGYSDEARQRKYSGEVGLSVVVDTEGHARDIKVTKSIGVGLDEKAIEAVEKWEFAPGTKDGKPVNVRVPIEVNFRLL